MSVPVKPHNTASFNDDVRVYLVQMNSDLALLKEMISRHHAEVDRISLEFNSIVSGLVGKEKNVGEPMNSSRPEKVRLSAEEISSLTGVFRANRPKSARALKRKAA
jgi:hypothetical protein